MEVSVLVWLSFGRKIYESGVIDGNDPDVTWHTREWQYLNE